MFAIQVDPAFTCQLKDLGDFDFKNYAPLSPSYCSNFESLVWEEANSKDLTTARHRLACRPLLGTFPENRGLACRC